MTEYGLFNDEGLVEGGFYSVDTAEAAILDRYDSEDELEVKEVCGDHEGQPYDGCEECFADDYCGDCDCTPCECDEEED
jgi:hypothetical protein